MPMTHSLAVEIPGGYWVDGIRCREAHLRELTGEDHASLIEEAGTLLPAEWATEALVRCLSRLGPCEPVTREAVRSLTVGDREALLLQLRRATWGDRLQCVLTCPSPGCGQKLDVDLKVSELLLPAYGEARERYDATLGRADVSSAVRFRLPNGWDQEAAAVLALSSDVGAAVDRLLERCVESVVSGDGSPVEEFPPSLVEPLSARMAELDAQAELILDVTCTECGHAFPAAFDAAGFLFQELQGGLRRLYHEVHLLAFHYHWSPSDILALSAGKRRRYIELLEQELLS
jgi:hypothetical protein